MADLGSALRMQQYLLHSRRSLCASNYHFVQLLIYVMAQRCNVGSHLIVQVVVVVRCGLCRRSRG